MNETAQRKDEHLRINLEENVSSALTAGFEKYHFIHNALPEIDLHNVDLKSTFLGRSLSAPLLISSMTGGTERASRINQSLAKAAQHFGIAIGVGSQRVALEDSDAAESFKIRKYCPDSLVLANLGAVQLNYGLSTDHCRQAVEMIEADALILHLNPLQEALQPEGDTKFSGLLSKIEMVCKQVTVPVIVKEVGWGIDASLAARLAQVGVSAVDVAGAGGTSWSQVEMHRLTDPVLIKTAGAFNGWGLPTADCLAEISRELPHLPLIASGGLKDGIDAAKSIALGARLAGFAGLFIRAASASNEALELEISAIIQQLRTAMFAIGACNLNALRHTPRLVRTER